MILQSLYAHCAPHNITHEYDMVQTLSKTETKTADRFCVMFQKPQANFIVFRLSMVLLAELYQKLPLPIISFCHFAVTKNI